ncbi:PREDICTED: mucin-2, partial [Condylura cristata]|uniref:mucin-2 n=1 Tax=Condylura cristata TaxID=143302 RepID=UPI0003347E7B
CISVCQAGRWVCKDLPCPGTCALEGGSHITTFDGKKYTFHGDCYYLLTRGEHNDSYALLGELAPCGSTDKQTCLKTVVLLADRKKNVVAFKSDGSVLLNELEVNLPHVTATFSIFRPSSYHIIVSTTFGLRLQVQLVPIMQLFVTIDQTAQGRVQGLCGNFNGLESDDFKTAGGLVEATGAGFANTWKVQATCHDKLDWLDDPCSLNIESANYAEHWCSLLKKAETPFGRCHSAVDPADYYKYQTECVSGCVCPEGLMDDGRGGCVAEKDCPCVHNKDLYSPGGKIKVDCNTCTCQRGRWVCSQLLCHGTCAIYGSGHYITFDGKHYDFEGHCSYVAAQDYCGQNASLGSFSIITENVPCGTTGVTCSKAIKIFLGRTELKLEDKHRIVIQRDQGHHVTYTTREVGQYLVVEASLGVIIIWDKRTTIFIKLAPSYKGSVCGLCGNFDQRSNNDFTTRDHMVVESELDFGNSWKEAPTCPDSGSTPDPCSKNPHRRAWAEKQCSIIKGAVFQVCHSKVDPKPFYEACVQDSCSCDSGGDCECFCSAVAAYAQECTKAGACVFWRTPDLCPVFCDYYNPPDECEWHYEPCGNRSLETCRTVNGIHSNISVSYLEALTCPQHREYRACGPVEEPTCNPGEQNTTVEGCFCPEGTTSYAPGFDVCVDTCGCVGPDNVPREFGEHFEFDCKDCVCLEGGSGIVCQPKRCGQKSSPTCSEEGTYPVIEVDPMDTCCNVTTCKCNVSLCKSEPHPCPLGFVAKSEMVPGRCCPVHSCVPKGVCVVGNAEYQPGSPVYASKCQNCQCTSQRNSTTQLNIISCSHVPCTTTCDLGFELVNVPGECCGKCQQTHCVINRPGGHHLVLKPGDMERHPGNNCTFFSCVKIHNQLISSVSNITCPDFDPSDCLPGSITLMPNGCCRTCTHRNETRVPCSTIPVTKEIVHAGCVANVTTNYCAGSCGTFAMYSAEVQALDRRCSCCKEASTSQRAVQLRCPTGDLLPHTYTHIESCQCQDSVCSLPLARRGRRSARPPGQA